MTRQKGPDLFEDEKGSIKLYHGDCLSVMKTLGTKVDTVITDPPYHLVQGPMGFGSRGGIKGAKWDGGDIAFRPETWEVVKDCMKPGGFLLAFGGTRTFHRMVCAIEDAGFEHRDLIMWLYSSGFPKSLNIPLAIDREAGEERERFKGVRSKGIKNYFALADTALSKEPITEAAKVWQGYGTTLKPAVEPIIVAMKPLDGTFAENALKHGVAGLAVDKCRVPIEEGLVEKNSDDGRGDGLWPDDKPGYVGQQYNATGRFPANVIHDGSEEVVASFPADKDGVVGSNALSFRRPISDWGSAARFFYCAKASESDKGKTNTHLTVKPIELMRYLCRLTKTPTGGIVLDPFAGSGSTLIAAALEGRDAIGIEQDEKHFKICADRFREEFGVANKCELVCSDGVVS